MVTLYMLRSVQPPICLLTLARAFNAHVVGNNAEDPEVLAQQRKVAIVTEMIHTASLVRRSEDTG